MLEDILYTRVHFFTEYILLELCDIPHVEMEDSYIGYIDCITVFIVLYCSTSVKGGACM